MSTVRVAGALGIAALSVTAPRLARAADAARGCAAREATTTRRWPAPLDRTITLHAENVALRDALDRLAAAAGISLSYSSDLLPLDRTVCVALDTISVGDALMELLGDAPVEPVIAAGGRVVLAPARPHPVSTGDLAPQVGLLDRVVVTGNANAAPDRALTIATEVVDGRRLAARSGGSLSDALDGSAPGVWMWRQSPTSLLASYGSVRGASSFGLSYPKMYIDGIEVANPLLVTQLNPETIDHIDVLRGPQEAALYGTDAISGVVNIVTRHDGTSPNGDRGSIRTSAGMAHSDFASHPVLVQDHTLAVRAGNDLRSASLSLGLGTTGEFVPGAFSREVRIGGGARLVGSRTSLSGTVRFYGKQAGIPSSPLLSTVSAPPAATSTQGSTYGGSSAVDSSWTPAAPTDTTPQSVRQYTVGATGTLVSSERWTHSLVVGVDGYRLSGDAGEYTPIPSALDSALKAARGGADRGTLRLTSVGRLGDVDRLSGTITVALEHSVLRAQTAGIQGSLAGTTTQGSTAQADSQLVVWRRNTGLSVQASTAWRNALFATGGMRVERTEALFGLPQLTALPMLGAAAVHDFGPVTAKVRGAYGRGIRPAQASPRELVWIGKARTPAIDLPPEQQAGIEAGMDLLIGRRFVLHATRFDQRAYGLIQPVGIVDSSAAGGGRMVYCLQNLGAITNRGWELQSSLTRGRFGLDGALSVVDSRVQHTALDYSGELRPGDRMLGVPARTLALSTSWTGSRWRGSIGAVRAANWVGYDRLALARVAAAGTGAPTDLTGANLRDYWKRYSGVTRLRASFSRDLLGSFSLQVTGENLLDQQRDEPDDLTVLPGRTLSLGLRARF